MHFNKIVELNYLIVDGDWLNNHQTIWPFSHQKARW